MSVLNKYENCYENCYEIKKFYYLFDSDKENLNKIDKIFKFQKQKTINTFIITNDNKTLFCNKNISFSLSYILNKLKKINKFNINLDTNKIIKCITTLYYEEFILLINGLINLNLIDIKLLSIFTINEIEIIFQNGSRFFKQINNSIKDSDLFYLARYFDLNTHLYNILKNFKRKYILKINDSTNIDLRFNHTKILIGDKHINNMSYENLINKSLKDMFGFNNVSVNIKYINNEMKLVPFDNNFFPVLITEVYDKVLKQYYYDLSYIIQLNYSFNELKEKFNKNNVSNVTIFDSNIRINPKFFTELELNKLIKY